jgi:hypothetical protein
MAQRWVVSCKSSGLAASDRGDIITRSAVGSALPFPTTKLGILPFNFRYRGPQLTEDPLPAHRSSRQQDTTAWLLAGRSASWSTRVRLDNDRQ